MLSTIWTFNSFTEVFLLTNGGPAGATRLYSILSWEYAISSLRIGVGVAVAVTMAPVLAIFIFFLGRYMSAGGTHRGGDGRSEATRPAPGSARLIAWPFKAIFGVLSASSAPSTTASRSIVQAIGR